MKDKSAVVVRSRRNAKAKPLVAFLDGPADYLEQLFSRAPEKTDYGEFMQKNLYGAAEGELIEKLAPVTERQLKAIYPKATATRMVDPLKTVDKTRIHDNIRRDGSTFMATLLLAVYTLGAESQITLGLDKRYATKQREDENRTVIQNNPEYLDILETLMKRDEDCMLRERQLEMLFAGAAFGRSVCVKQYDAENQPCRLIPLSSPRLGRVWIDKFNWEFLGVEYNDYTTDRRILLAKDIIHYEENDFSVTPNSRYYGMSLAEPSISIGERNRAANEIAIPEIMKRYFTPLIKVTAHTKSQAKLDQIKNAWKSGKIIFINDDIEVEVIPVQHDLEKVRDTVMEGAKQIYRNYSIPLSLGFQDEQNRSTMEGSVLAWYEGPIAFRRSRLDIVMWHQWYKPQLQLIFSNRTMQKTAETADIFEYIDSMMQGKPMAQTQQAVAGAAAYDNKIQLPFRIVTEFTNIRTVGFLDTSAAVAQFYDRKLLSPDIARMETGLGKYNDDMAEYEASTQTMANDMFSQNMQMAEQPGTVENNLLNTNLETQGTSKFGKGLPTRSTPRPSESESE